METFRPDMSASQPLPIASAEVEAGLFSFADSHHGMLDLQSYLIPRPSSTFFVKAKGDSMTGVGIFAGDLLIVDRSRQAQSGHIIIAQYQGEFTLKRLLIDQGKIFLKAENPLYPLLPITQPDLFEVWGVVMHVIHSF